MRALKVARQKQDLSEAYNKNLMEQDQIWSNAAIQDQLTTKLNYFKLLSKFNTSNSNGLSKGKEKFINILSNNTRLEAQLGF